MVTKISTQAVLTTGLGSLMGGIGLFGIKKLSSVSTPYAVPLTTSLCCAAIATPSTIALEKGKVSEVLKKRYGDTYHYEEIAFMIMTLVGTFVLTYTAGPKIAKRNLTRLEVLSFTPLSTAGGIIALLSVGD